MSIETSLYTYLSTYSGLAALVSTRVYPMVLPQSATLPAVTYQRISGVRVEGFGGPVGLAHPRFQFSCWAATYASACAVANQVRLALDGFGGTMGGTGGTTGVAAVLENDLEFYEAEAPRYQHVLDFTIWHQE